MNSTRLQIDELLCETSTAALHRESSAFDRVAESRRKIVIFGAGRLGRNILAQLAGTDLEVIAFADNNPDMWGTRIAACPVLKPEDAAAKYRDEPVFVVSIWHPSRSPLMSGLLTQLRNLSCRAVAFPVLFWRDPDRFLPYFFWDRPSKLLRESADIQRAFDLLEDDLSRQTFVDQLRLRLRADFDCAKSPVAGEQYFPGLFSTPADECFVDCGSYTGDTIQTFISQTRNVFRKIIAFEADQAVLPQLEALVSGIGNRASLHKAAVGATNGFVHFSGDGIGGGRITGGTGLKVPCVSLDVALANEYVTFIKMDIEGAELEALEGAQQTIERDRPVLAVCGYHAPDHLWRVPLLLKKLAPHSCLFLCSHCVDGLDTVCYSVPPERAITLGSGCERALSAATLCHTKAKEAGA